MSAPKITFKNGIQTPETTKTTTAPKIVFENGIQTPESRAQPLPSVNADPIKSAASALKTALPYAETPAKTLQNLSNVMTGGTLPVIAGTAANAQKYAQAAKEAAVRQTAEKLKTALPMADTPIQSLQNVQNVTTGGMLPVLAGHSTPTKTTSNNALQSPVFSGYADKQDFAGNRDYAGGGRENNQFSAGKLLSGLAVKGVDEFVGGLTSTAAWLENMTLGKLFPGTTDNSPIQAINDRVQQAREHNQKYTAPNVAAGGKAAEIIDKYGTATVAAVPQALLALYSGGASTAAQGTTAGLQAASTAAQASPGVISTMRSAVSSLAKDPQYWLSFAQVAGPSYDQAKADGADDTRASLYALGNGLMNAAVEVGGGIQTLPAELQQGTGMFKTWVDSMLDEGKEEVVQGVLERGLQNLIYNKDNPLVGIKDENAILNPRTAGEEFLGGAVVGGILGGAQTGINAAVNARAKTTLPMLDDTTTQENAVEGIPGQNKTASTGETALPKMSIADFTDANSSAFNNLPYEDVETQKKIMRETHNEMVADGKVVQVPESTAEKVGQPYPDLRSMKKSERTPILRQKMSELKTSLRQFLNEMKGGSYEFEVNGNILDAKLYDTGVREVMAQINQDKVSMLYHSDQVFQNAQYLYSTPDYDSDPNVYRWNYFYTPVQVGDKMVGVRIAIRDMANPQESQIYNWGIKRDASVDDEGRGQSRIPSGVSLDTSNSNTSILNETSGVKNNYTQNSDVVSTPGSGLNGDTAQRPQRFADGLVDEVDGYGRNTVGSAEAVSPYQEAPTQSVADRMFTEQEMQNHDLESKHQVYTNKQSRYDAEVMLSSDYEGEVERLKTDEWGPAENVEGHMILEDLVEQARKTGTDEDWAKVREWKKLYDRKGGTEVGQTLQSRARFANSAANITAEAADFLGSDKAKRLSDAKKQKVMEDVANQSETLENIEEGDTDSLIALIERNSEIRRTTGFFSKKTSKQMDWALHKIAELYPDADSFLRGVAASQTRGIYTDYAKVSFTERAKSLRIQFMLSKIATVMRNLGSNNVFDPIETLSNNIGVVADQIMSLATGQRTTALEKSWASKAKRHGSLEGALKSFVEVGLDADSTGSKYEGTGGRTFKMTGNFLERFLSTWSKFQNYTLTTTDEFQKGGIRAETQENIDELKRSGKLDADSLNEWADETAKQRTFQNDSATALAMEGLRRKTLNRFHVKDIGAGDILVPFARVPGNLVHQAANYSPVGAFNGFRQMVQVMLDAKNGNYSAEAQAQAARNIGRGVNGTVLLAGFTALAAKGLIKVAGADDEDKEALEKAQGKTGTQWNLSATMRALNGESTEWRDGDMLMSIGFLDPINSIMAAGAFIADAYQEDGTLTVEEVADASFSALFQSVLDLPAMSSINDLSTAYKYADGETPAQKGLNALKDYAAGELESFLVPNALRGIATGLDDTVRNRYTGETFGDSAKEGIVSGLPMLRETLPASLDPFGREKTQTGNTVMNILNNNLLPGALTKYKETEVEKTLESVYDATGNAAVYPTKKAPNSFEVDGEKFTLDAEQKDEFMTTAGETALEIMMDMIDSYNFQMMNEETQGQYLAVANEYARAVAKVEVSDGKYELTGTNKKISAAEDAGMSAADYIMYKLNSGSYDEDGSGSMTIGENAKAIQNSGMSKKEQEAYWLVTYPEWPEKAAEKGVDISDYINYKVAVYGVEGEKNAAGKTISGSKKKNMIAALMEAGYSQAEANQLYNKIG